MWIFILSLLLFSCAPTGESGGGSTNSTTNKTDGDDNSQVNVPGSDPLYSYQWYLVNSGNNIFSYSGFSEDADIDWSPSFSYKGKDQFVIVSDGGLKLSTRIYGQIHPVHFHETFLHPVDLMGKTQTPEVIPIITGHLLWGLLEQLKIIRKELLVSLRKPLSLGIITWIRHKAKVKLFLITKPL